MLLWFGFDYNASQISPPTYNYNEDDDIRVTGRLMCSCGFHNLFCDRPTQWVCFLRYYVDALHDSLKGVATFPLFTSADWPSECAACLVATRKDFAHRARNTFFTLRNKINSIHHCCFYFHSYFSKKCLDWQLQAEHRLTSWDFALTAVSL